MALQMVRITGLLWRKRTIIYGVLSAKKKYGNDVKLLHPTLFYGKTKFSSQKIKQQICEDRCTEILF
jgi:hypothetical protein